MKSRSTSTQVPPAAIDGRWGCPPCEPTPNGDQPPDLNPRSKRFRWAQPALPEEVEEDDGGAGLRRGIMFALPLALVLWALLIAAGVLVNKLLP